MVPASDPGAPREQAETMIRSGNVDLGDCPFPNTEGQIRSELLTDASDQVAGQVVSALVARAMMVASTTEPPPPDKSGETGCGEDLC